jgi:HEAT repeat protein
MWLPSFLQLKASDPDVRLQAIHRLAETKNARAIQGLSEAFFDEVPGISLTAAVYLGKMGMEEATQFLLKQLRQPSPQLRQAAVQGLKLRKEPEVQAALVECLKDVDPGVRARAAQALDAGNWRPSDPSEEIWFAVAQGQLSRAAKHGPQAIEALELVIGGGPFNLQVAAVRALGMISDERVFKSLVAMLGSEDHAVTVAAVEALTNFGGLKALDVLRGMLKHSDNRVRAAAAESMAELGAQLCVPELVSLLKDEAWDVRSAAANSLGKLKATAAFEPLVALLQDPDNDVRETTVRALGRLADARAIGPLVLSLVDIESGVRRAATSTLRALSRLWHKTEAAQQMTGELRKALESGDVAVRFAATLVLQQLGATSMISGFEAASILTTSVQKQARVLSILSELLIDRDSDVRFAAAKSLGELCDERAVPALRPAAEDDNVHVRRAAIEALSILEGT